MDNSLISIIIPVYNVEQYLGKCLDSVISQTYKNLEIILVDDGSTDNSGKICDEYALKDNRIKVIHKKNAGVSIARNTGLNITRGDYIGFVDGDDYIECDMYETLLKKILETNSKLVVCNWFEGTENNWVENKIFPKKEMLTTNEALESFYWCMFSWNKLFDKSIIKNILFPENCGYGEDILVCLEAYKKAEMIISFNEPKYYYRRNLNSALNSHRFKKIYLGLIDVLEKEMNYAKENKLFDLYKKIYEHQIHATTAWIGFIALEKEPDIESATILIKYVKKNLIAFLKTKAKITKKCFILLVCINFNLASKIYKLIYRKNS